MNTHEFQKGKIIDENHVCSKCFYPSEECKCEPYLPWRTIFIDKNIQEVIRILNEKGYWTDFCCEGHYPYYDVYISFSGYSRSLKDVVMPEDFKYIKTRRVIRHKREGDTKVKDKMTIEEFEAEKKKYLNALLEWAKDLPEEN